VQRVTESVRPCLSVVRKGILRKKAIEVSLIEELSPSLARDGVEKKGAPQGTGERAWWTQQAISLVPPSFWRESLGMSTEELAEAAIQSEEEQLLDTAWINAALRYKDAEMARALLPVATGNLWAPIFAILSPADREDAALNSDLREGLGRPGFTPPPAMRTSFFILYCEHPWSLSFTRAVAERAANWPAAERLQELGRFACIDYLDEIPADAPPALLELASVLRFRREMHQAIQNRQ